MKQKEMDESKRWYNKVPHTMVILFIMVVFAGILTWIVPAGEYDNMMVNGRSVVDGTSYHVVEKNPANIFELFTAIPKGLEGSAQIIFMILLSSGTFALMNYTGAIDTFIGAMLRQIKKSNVNPALVVFLVTFLFSCMGIVIGPEIIIPFTSISVSIALGLGYDVVVGAAMVIVGGYVGFCMGPVCASTIGTADAICGLPLFSGAGLRFLAWLATTLCSCAIVVSYANKVKKDPMKSYALGVDTTGLALSDNLDNYVLDSNKKKVLIVFAFMFVAMIVGPILFGWYLDQLMAVFIIAAIVVALATHMNNKEAIDVFCKGAGAMFGVAMLVGMGRAIQVILTNGKVMHTIIYYLSKPISHFSPFIASVIMSLVHTVINFLIPSGSGQAAATMPIMFPLGQLVGITDQVNIFAFQIGDGFSNMLYPTVGALMAMLGIARVPYNSWVKLALKIVGIMMMIGWVFLFIGGKINWGPF